MPHVSCVRFAGKPPDAIGRRYAGGGRTQLAYADDTVQTLLHEQKQTMLNLVSISLPNVTGNDRYAAGFNAALAQVRSAVQAWNFAYKNGRSDTK